MTEKELRQLSRRELLEMLIAQMEENERLKQQLGKAQSSLQSRQLSVQNAGSIAEAALQVNGVFEAAQAAAEQYLENLRQMSDQQEEITKQIQMDAQKQADSIIAEANAYTAKAHAEADAYWERIFDKAQRILQDQDYLRQLVQNGRDRL